ncbi:hypothetical protein LTR70_006891 [Exophiala xenobiotica]|uniref:Uncharacterized protein n=1 Tax=Lithohypha guttulata TaxID=1690604 RepID=A0ABR0K5J4_9EURO|nr:hypothetical protein LTR24_006542 [Lithohypha guttulata]KAK5314929.1 hypothetical protein LTR70_006891 [Exophiala xenobiotica]
MQATSSNEPQHNTTRTGSATNTQTSILVRRKVALAGVCFHHHSGRRMDTETSNPRTAELAHDQRPDPPPQPSGDIDTTEYDTDRVPTPEMAVILSITK